LLQDLSSHLQTERFKGGTVSLRKGKKGQGRFSQLGKLSNKNNNEAKKKTLPLCDLLGRAKAEEGKRLCFGGKQRMY